MCITRSILFCINVFCLPHERKYFYRDVGAIILGLTAGIVILLDQLSKLLIRQLLYPGQSVDLLGFIRITLVKNPGAAFGILPNHQLIFLITTIIVVIFIIFYYKQLKPHEGAVKFALGLELGGAMGNLVDRVFFGKVTDFIDFRIWPVFNVADIAIVVGLVILAWAVYRSQDEEGKLSIKREPETEQKSNSIN